MISQTNWKIDYTLLICVYFVHVITIQKLAVIRGNASLYFYIDNTFLPSKAEPAWSLVTAVSMSL